MIETAGRRWNVLVTAMSILVVAEATTFLLASLLHLGIPLPPGLSQPQIIPATIVEGLCGIFLAISAYALFARKRWAWRAALAAHLFAVAGVLLGLSVTLRNPGSDMANAIYHRVMLVTLIVVLVLLITPGIRATLGSRKR